jgi:hypothetical protein
MEMLTANLTARRIMQRSPRMRESQRRRKRTRIAKSLRTLTVMMRRRAKILQTLPTLKARMREAIPKTPRRPFLMPKEDRRRE